MDTPNTHFSSHRGPACVANATGRPPKSVFLATVFVVFVLSLSAADSVGFVPSYIDGTETVAQDSSVSLADLPQLGSLEAIEAVAPQAIQEGILPERINAPSIGLDIIVQNPSTKDVEILDTYLQKGSVRYVDSAKLGESGNMLVFAHSSHLPIVHNQMYKAFNRINELKVGDSISVFGSGPSTGPATTGGREYLYSVTEVRLTDAKEEIIDLSKTNGTHLTLSTCDTFGKKSARWIVEADLVGTVPSRN